MDALWKRSEERIERLAGLLCQGSVSNYNELRKTFIFFHEIYKNPMLPDANEIAAVAFDDEKVAGLFFDRIASDPFSDIPSEVRIHCGTDYEFFSFIFALLSSEEKTLDYLVENVMLDEATDFEDKVDELNELNELNDPLLSPARHISSLYYVAHGLSVTPIYSSGEKRDFEFQPGKNELVLATIEGLQLAINDALTWEQVLEIRKDKEAIVKLRRLRNWLDREMIGKPISFVTDAIAVKLSDYEWAIKKHGIKTVTGTISQLLDPKSLAAVGAASVGLVLAGQDFLGAIAGTGILVGKAALSITEKLVDLRDIKRGTNAEIAFVHDLAKLAK